MSDKNIKEKKSYKLLDEKKQKKREFNYIKTYDPKKGLIIVKVPVKKKE